MVQYEAMVLALMAFALFVMVSVYFKTGGIIGLFLRKLILGTFGISGWFVPVGLFVVCIFKVFNRGNERLNMKIIEVILLLSSLSVLGHLNYVKQPQMLLTMNNRFAFFYPSLSNYFSVSAKHGTGGGFVGGFVGDLSLYVVGRAGSMIMILAILAVLLIAITEQSLFSLLKKIHVILTKLFDKGRSSFEAAMAENREKRKLIKEERIREEQYFAQQNQEVKEVASEGKKVKKKNRIYDFMFKDDNDFTQLVETETEQVIEEVTEEVTEEVVSNHFFDEPIEGFDLKEELIQVLPEDDPISSIEPIATLTIEKSNIQNSTKDKVTVPKQESLLTHNEVAKPHKKPPMELLKENPVSAMVNRQGIQLNSRKLEATLESFGVNAKVVDVSVGPTVTRYELQPDVGVKVSKIVNLSDDIALNLAASGIRIEAPIPNKSVVGIEVPNAETTAVFLREVIDTPEFSKSLSPVSFALGKDISGQVIVTDIAKMPHLLIAGATGSGKSVCVNTLITSILYKASPDEVKFLMIDPKVVELSIYNGIPHLLIPVVTDARKAANALNWAVMEMMDRYKQFADVNVRDMKSFNKAAQDNPEMTKMPNIVIIVDELADLMVVASKEVEDSICRLAQMARAAGLHLVIATQRPSVDVITGVIKANIPSRIAFNVSSQIDSRTILDMAGAEKLLGKGDMLFYPVGMQKPIRIQGAFVSDKEVENIVTFLKDRRKQEYNEKILNQLDKSVVTENEDREEYDPIFEEALLLCIEKEKASSSMIQRKFRIGYNRAARIIDQLHEAGYIGEEDGSKARKVYITIEEFEELKAKANGENKAAQTTE
ncbi:MAG: DNA translocase FtsK [Vallitaleaceae bacterium]|nr:DNA translocase FtsK [Vallitaleaceae bacterium]